MKTYVSFALGLCVMGCGSEGTMPFPSPDGAAMQDAGIQVEDSGPLPQTDSGPVIRDAGTDSGPIVVQDSGPVISAERRDACATYCDTLFARYFGFCATDAEGRSRMQYETRDECYSKCLVAPFRISNGAYQDHYSDTIRCRTYWAQRANDSTINISTQMRYSYCSLAGYIPQPYIGCGSMEGH